MAGRKRTTRTAKKSRISVVRRLQRRTRQLSCATRRCWKEGCTKTFSSRRAMFQHDKYMHDRVMFEGRFVTLCIRKFGFKRLKLRADQLVRHFSHTQIRKAVPTYSLLAINIRLLSCIGYFIPLYKNIRIVAKVFFICFVNSKKNS